MIVVPQRVGANPLVVEEAEVDQRGGDALDASFREGNPVRELIPAVG